MANKKILNFLCYKNRKKKQSKSDLQKDFSMKKTKDTSQKSEKVLKLRRDIDEIGSILSKL